MDCKVIPPKGFGPCERHVKLHFPDLTTPALESHVFSKPHSGEGYKARWVVQRPVKKGQ